MHIGFFALLPARLVNHSLSHEGNTTPVAASIPRNMKNKPGPVNNLAVGSIRLV